MTNLHFHVLYKTNLQTYNKDHQVQRKKHEFGGNNDEQFTDTVSI